MVMTDEKLREISLKPKSTREYLDLMIIVVNLEHYYRKMKMNKLADKLPENIDIENLVKKFLSEYKKIKLKPASKRSDFPNRSRRT